MSGSNDCASDCSVEDVVGKLNNLTDVATSFSEEPVTLSSICPVTCLCFFDIKKCFDSTSGPIT